MVVSREREIRNFVKVPYYKIVGEFGNKEENKYFKAEWRVTDNSFAALLPYIIVKSLEKFIPIK